LWQILAQMLADRAIPYEQETGDALHEIISGLYASRDETFGNAGEMRNLVDALDRRRAARIVQNNLPDNDPLQIQDVPPGYQGYLQPLISQEEILQEIDAITGLEPFKLYLKELIVNQQEETEGSRNHLIFKGLAGTGKSYAVQFLGACLKKLGWLQKGHVVEVTRSDLIAGYVGQTAGKTREVIRSALDGILVINHAVDLMAQGSGDFQRDALTALYRGMEDYGHRLLVVLTGAPAEIDRLTAGSPGIRDHFLQVIEFATPSIEELVAFLNTAAQQDRYAFSPEALEKIKAYLHGAAVSERNQFGNYRAAIALFAKIRTQFHKRIRAGGGENSPETQREILPEDIPEPYYPVVVSAADALAQPPTGEKKIINHDWVLPVGSHSPIEKRSNDQEKNGES
jgi:hypothetical protein